MKQLSQTVEAAAHFLGISAAEATKRLKWRLQNPGAFQACKIVGQQVALLARRCANGVMTLAQFTNALLEIEAGEVHSSGLILSATNTLDEWTNVSLKVPGSPGPCVEFEFLPAAGKFRELVSP